MLWETGRNYWRHSIIVRDLLNGQCMFKVIKKAIWWWEIWYMTWRNAYCVSSLLWSQANVNSSVYMEWNRCNTVKLDSGSGWRVLSVLMSFTVICLHDQHEVWLLIYFELWTDVWIEVMQKEADKGSDFGINSCGVLWCSFSPCFHFGYLYLWLIYCS